MSACFFNLDPLSRKLARDAVLSEGLFLKREPGWVLAYPTKKIPTPKVYCTSVSPRSSRKGV